MITITEVILGIDNSSRKEHRITIKRNYIVESMHQLENYRNKLLYRARKVNNNAYVDFYYITK